jgi:hypothetical protein
MNLIVFFGAGISIPSGLPAAKELTDRIFAPRRFDDESNQKIQDLLELIRNYDQTDITSNGASAFFRSEVPTYEDVFYLCQELVYWGNGWSDHSLTTAFLEKLQRQAGRFLAEKSRSYSDLAIIHTARLCCDYITDTVAQTLRRSYVRGLDCLVDVAKSPMVSQLSIATLNHDTLVEQHLTACDIGFADGFGPRDGAVRWRDDATFDNPEIKARIFKLHGSVDWYQITDTAGGQRLAIVPETDLADIRNGAGASLSASPPRPMILTGLNKSVSYNRAAYSDFHFRFWDALRRSNRMVMCGYGWGDEAISAQIEGWMDRSRDNRLLLFHPTFHDLVDHSLILGRSQRSWIEAGRLVVTPKWLGEASAQEILAPLA